MDNHHENTLVLDELEEHAAGPDFGDWLRVLRVRWRTVAAAAALGAGIGFGSSFLLTPRWASHTTFLPPAQQQSSAASALSSLGMLSGLGAGGIKSPVEQYISLMGSESATDRIIDRFELMKVYDCEYREQARRKLATRTTMYAGKKDGLLTVQVQDTDPKRAAAIAMQYVEELRRLTSSIAVTEAQQRRVFFQNQLQEAKQKLIEAQTALSRSGFSQGALRVEPSVSGESYARIRSDLAAAQIRLETLRGSLADTAPEVRSQTATVNALQTQITKFEQASDREQAGPEYVSRYREFKYEETLFDSMARQYELARIDESREGALIQVIDPAHPAERKSFPRRSYCLGAGFAAGFLLAAVTLIARRPRPPKA